MAKKARIGQPNGKTVKADEVHCKAPFFCDTDNCDAPMIIVSMGEKSAYFRSKSISDHKFSICVRNDIEFNADKYDKDLFKLEKFKSMILGSYERPDIHNGSGHGGTVGSGSKIAPDTLKSIYAAYIESLSSGIDIIGNSNFSAFMRCKENYTAFVLNPSGFFVVEGTYYHKVKDEFAILLNVPMFNPRKKQTYHVKVSFKNKNDFWRVFDHHNKLQKSYLSVMLVAAEWVAVTDNLDYFAECTISKSSQHTYISLDD